VFVEKSKLLTRAIRPVLSDLVTYYDLCIYIDYRIPSIPSYKFGSYNVTCDFLIVFNVPYYVSLIIVENFLLANHRWYTAVNHSQRITLLY